jgi:hypothetical protein
MLRVFIYKMLRVSIFKIMPRVLEIFIVRINLRQFAAICGRKLHTA